MHSPIPNCLAKTFWVCISIAVLPFSVATSLAQEDSSFSKTIAPAIEKHCLHCHGANSTAKGGINFSSLNAKNLREHVELIRETIDVLDFAEMPPEDEPPMSPKLRDTLIEELQKVLSEILESEQSFAPTPIRRMNRFQYNNSVVDLLDLKCIVFTLPERMLRDHNQYFQPASGKMAELVNVGSRPLGKSQMIEPRLSGVAAFPQDLRAEHGFDNRADHLSMSPLLMESFLKLGQSITGSPDFTAKNVGIWAQFFAPPNREILVAPDELKKELLARLTPFLTRAFRQKVEPNTLNRYAEFAFREIQSGGEFPEVMKSVVAATVASPKFIYLYDKSTESQKAQHVDDFELASRLSFFLWGSLPDQELLDLASNGELGRTKTFEQQIDRMLKDRKLKRFCDSFPTQWLQLERIISSVPDPKKFPTFYFAKYRDSMHMMLEPLLLFETVLIENLPITQLIDSSFTYRSKRLENAYGELASNPAKKETGNGVAVLRFRRVPINDRRTGGIITNAAVMTMTAGPERSKPITRGAWIAGVIFNDPPAPPPADVPTLEETPSHEEAHLTLRERLDLHRTAADCRGCHEQIDPLGFALENYDAIGSWRDKYANGREVDMAGNLFRKHPFNDVTEFKDAILKEKDRFTKGLAGHLLSFALARELVASDHPALEKIVKATAAGDYRFQTLIKQVILSEPFLNKSNPAEPTALRADRE